MLRIGVWGFSLMFYRRRRGVVLYADTNYNDLMQCR